MPRATPDLSFDEWHNSEYVLALAYARKGRESAEYREFCADKITAIYDNLEQQLAQEAE